MKRLSKQQGFGVVSMIGLLITISFISYFLLQLGIQAKREAIYNNSKNFYQQIDEIKGALQQYQVDKINQNAIPSSYFAKSWADLTPNYLPSCSNADSNAGKCRKAEDTPWGTKMTLTALTIPTSSGLQLSNQLTIPLPPVTAATKFEHDVVVETLIKLPFAKWDSARNTITWQVRKVGTELSYSQLVKRDGSSQLTGDWDVGGKYAITNAKDVTVENADGSQRSLAASTFLIAKDGQQIPKNACPLRLHPQIITSVKSILNTTNNAVFSSVGSLRAYATDSGYNWTVHLDYVAKIKGSYLTRHSGEINVQLVCKL